MTRFAGLLAMAGLAAMVFVSASDLSGQPTAPSTGTPPTETPPDAPPTGTMTLTWGTGVDLDRNPIWLGTAMDVARKALTPDIDLYVERDPKSGPFHIRSAHGALFSTANRDAKTDADCAAGDFSTEMVPIAEDLSGASLCLRTTGGGLALLHIDALSLAPRNVQLAVSYTIWR